ncbi:hypothetical protein DID75_01910 [Candidatus Marinamargulisbacteria bacterium SCGC AG-410-N11]|nr:hypothetical protein DID75_01910 [Candidatus Marinamargulisbacteria bacterium SCGC AG-410-N11]
MQIQVTYQNNKTYKLGIISIKQQQYLEALEQFKSFYHQYPHGIYQVLIFLYKELRIHFDSLELRMVIAEIYIFIQNYTEAIQELEDILDLNINHPQAYYLINKIYQKVPQFSYPIQIMLEKAFSEKIFDSSVIDCLSKIYIDSKQVNKKIGYYSTLIEHFPDRSDYYKVLALSLLEKQQYTKAISILKNYLSKFKKSHVDVINIIEKSKTCTPLNTNINSFLIELYFNSFQMDKALSLIEQLCSQNPNYFPDAIQQINDALKTYPNNHDLLFYQIKLLLRQDSLIDACEKIKQLVNLTPSYVVSLIQLIQDNFLHDNYSIYDILIFLYIKNKDYTHAYKQLTLLIDIPNIEISMVQAYISTIKSNSNQFDLELALLTAKLYYLNKEYETCINTCRPLFSTSLDKDSRLLCLNSINQLATIIDYKELIYNTLELYPFNKDIHESIQLLQKNVIDSEVIKLSKNMTQKNDYLLGLLNLRNDNIFAAIEHFQLISSDHDNFINAQLLISRCFLELGKFKMAYKQIERTLPQLDPSNIALINKSTYLMGISKFHLGLFESAVQNLESILESDVNFTHLRSNIDLIKSYDFSSKECHLISGCFLNNFETLHIIAIPTPLTVNSNQSISFAYPHNMSGIQFCIDQNYNSAKSEFNLCIQVDPKMVFSYCNLAVIELHEQNPQNAIELLEKANLISPNNDTIFHLYGLAYLLKKEFKLAIDYFQQALKLNGNQPLYYLNLGDAYYLSNHLLLAFEYWKKSYSLGTLFYIIQRRINYLSLESFGVSNWISIEPLNFDLKKE